MQLEKKRRVIGSHFKKWTKRAKVLILQIYETMSMNTDTRTLEEKHTETHSWVSVHTHAHTDSHMHSPTQTVSKLWIPEYRILALET